MGLKLYETVVDTHNEDKEDGQSSEATHCCTMEQSSIKIRKSKDSSMNEMKDCSGRVLSVSA